ncbi:hypothetical protein [Phenylobacterium kunshanense]|nr:hypothetical protein [Phenylobacterium kunshanense]
MRWSVILAVAAAAVATATVAIPKPDHSGVNTPGQIATLEVGD